MPLPPPALRASPIPCACSAASRSLTGAGGSTCCAASALISSSSSCGTRSADGSSGRMPLA
eukprot:3537822-Prymnesium_polylepis.1